MPLTDKEKQRLNLSLPVANDIKLGDIVRELQEGGGKGEKGDPGKDGSDGAKGDPGKDGSDGAKGDPGKDGAPGKDGTDGKDGFGDESEYNDIITRLEELEGAE